MSNHCPLYFMLFSEAETCFKTWNFFCTVVVVHLLALILKLFYYKFQHPWMSLSKAIKSLNKIVYAVLGVISVGICGSLIYLLYYLYPDDHISSTLEKEVNQNCLSDYQKIIKENTFLAKEPIDSTSWTTLCVVFGLLICLVSCFIDYFSLSVVLNSGKIQGNLRIILALEVPNSKTKSGNRLS